MARKVGKRKTREKRILEPATYLVASEGNENRSLILSTNTKNLNRLYVSQALQVFYVSIKLSKTSFIPLLLFHSPLKRCINAVLLSLKHSHANFR